MTKKEILLKVWVTFSYVYWFYLTVKAVLGKANTLDITVIIICYLFLALALALKISLKIVKLLFSYRLCKIYEKNLEYLKYLHKTRYKLYFTGDTERINEYSKKIERYSSIILDNGENALSTELLNKKQARKIQEILNQTRELMTTT